MHFIATHWKELLGVLVVVVEQILPMLPIKANSTTQLVINAAKEVLPKKEAQK